MNQLNNVIIEGSLIDDPKVIATNSKTEDKLVKFTIANDRYYKNSSGVNKKETLLITVQCWGDLGERCLMRIHKGMIIRAVGSLMLCKWNGNNGEKKETIEIVCNHIEFRAPKPNSKMEIIADKSEETD